jgi:hypothetical protein
MRAMILQLRRSLADERVSALLFCLQLLGGSTSPISASPGPGLAIVAGNGHESQVFLNPAGNDHAHAPGRVRRPQRIPAFKAAPCGKCIAGAGVSSR